MSDLADIGMGGFVASYERSLVVDLSTPIISNKFIMFMRTPNDLEFNWFSYISIFSVSVYLCLFAAIFISGSLLHLIFTILVDASPVSKEFLFSKPFIFTFGAFTFIRRWCLTPKNISPRVIFITCK